VTEAIAPYCLAQSIITYLYPQMNRDGTEKMMSMLKFKMQK
jgi:hypothetical protein